jgi:hypothetical protein
MDLVSWILPILTIGCAIALIALTLKNSRRWHLALGVLIGVSGLAIAGNYLWIGIEPDRNQPTARVEQKPDLSSSSPIATLIVPEFSASSGESSGRSPFRIVSLNNAGEDLSGLEAPGTESKRASVIILDASKGVHSTYVEKLHRAFGELKANSLDEKVTVCWRRTSFFPYATGLCETRSAAFTMNPENNDLARVENERATARAKTTSEGNFVLVTHSIPERDQAREESCLLALAQGRICTAAEILPGPTTAAIAIDSDESINRQVLEEFALAQNKDLTEALRVYEEPFQPKIEKIENTEANGTCHGLLDHTRLLTTDLTWLSKSLRTVTKENALGKELLKLNSYLACPGLLTLDLPPLRLRDQRSAARSLLTHLKDFTFWFTSPAGYLNRVYKTDFVRLSADENERKIWVQSPSPVQALALSVVTPTSFPEELLQSVNLLNSKGEWRIYRMGPNGFRITMQAANDLLGIDFAEFIGNISQPKLRFKTFFGTYGVSSSLQLAFLVAAILSLIHALAPQGPNRDVKWSFTFIPVAVISFVILFLSQQTARRPAGSDASLALIETPPQPSHIFLRDWPSEWFEVAPPSPSQLALTAEMQKKNARWLKLLSDAQARASSLSAKGSFPREINARLSGTALGAATAGSRDVIIWDIPRARNYFFRKSPVYQSTMIGWQNLLERERWLYSESASASGAISSPQAVVVVPDLRFIANDDLSALENHVAAGGVLVFSEKLALDDLEGVELKLESLKSSGAFGQTLADAGYGKSRASRYSTVSTDGFDVENINVEHRIAAKSGHGPDWINSVSYKSGAVVFLGVQPLEARSQSVITAILKRLQGERRSVRDPGPDCATALFVQPYGAGQPTMSAFASEVRRAGIDVHWIVDPVSMARMMPIWEKSFRNDGIVFLDDGRPESRQVASDLLKALKGEGARPVFATPKPGPDGMLEGPPGDMILMRELAASDIDENVAQWSSECVKGVATARLIVSNGDPSEWRKRAAAIVSGGPKKTLDLHNLIERRQLPVMPAPNLPHRDYKFKLSDPLRMILEQP